MNRHVFAAAAMLGALALAPGAQSAPTEQTFLARTTGELAELCGYSSSTDVMATAAQNFCEGFLVGAYQVLVQVNAARRHPAFCVANPPSRNQAIAAFLQWVKANPGEASRPPADGVFEFLTQRFPCPAKP